MAMSTDLFLAILSLDSYNRGYDPGLAVNGSQLGNASLSIDSSVLRDANGQRFDQPVSFFAQAYSWNDQTVISYRGTDSLVWDPIYGATEA